MLGWEIRNFDVRIEEGGKGSVGGGVSYVLQ